ncbi:uncharacterized protein LOC104887078 [Beta vulgaris subsp. vulgaris]|uniref:uncharacterized protein LOC104887078 n=1 Tax=Beta vulgaris subsp. vulgaris TaxID=3555 RepID=UPI0005400471|nr:uncharacterized protein LOC104887078 [Beta vulgaris subsp. vulgaris]
MQKYSLKGIYAKLCVEEEHVTWDKFVWNRISIPKHRVITWLIMKNRLNTADRLLKYGLIHDDACQFCSTGRETQEHLFFQCDYSRKCVDLLRSWLGMVSHQYDFQRIVRFWRNNRTSCFKKKVLAAVLKVAVYFIWWARNEAVWNLVGWRPDQIVHRVKSLTILRINTVLPKKTSTADRAWFDLLKSR